MNSYLQIGDPAPDFTLPTNHGGSVTLSDLQGHRVVIYFYPKDDTPGCTTEAKGFTEALPEFTKHHAHIIGISRDPIARHDKFIEKYNLKITLASDLEGDVTEAYGVWVEKNMYGRKYFGIERATYLIDAAGNISQIWRKVRVKAHVEAVLSAVSDNPF